MAQRPWWYGHICGCYYLGSAGPREGVPRRYLPLVEVKAHATLFESVSSTALTQRFINTNPDTRLKSVRYAFPLFDGISVVDFTCRIGKRVIRGLVKERHKAKQDYQQAISQGETAALLEQLPNASDVFTTTIGNVPAGAEVLVTIRYLGELRHDAEVNGTRLNIPTYIAPRYGSYPGEIDTQPSSHNNKGIEITVDANMEAGSFIQKIQSPSHPISVAIGTLSSAPDAEPSNSKGSATLALSSTELDKDFVLQVVTKNVGTPKAILETHPSLHGQRALMTTLVPRFSLKPIYPEIVFVCDRSGSMSGNMQPLISALNVFLKSIPVGVKFNICSFGSSFHFLWPKSQSYSQDTLGEAVEYVNAFKADMGGTEILLSFKETVKRRLTDLNTEIILLTDGNVHDQHNLFVYINKEVEKSKDGIRVFSIGIGGQVSSALVNGIARAGKGFVQFVLENEKVEQSMVRVLKACRTPHITNYKMEIKYRGEHGDIVENIADSLRIKLALSEPAEFSEKDNTSQAPISLFSEDSGGGDVIVEDAKPSNDPSGRDCFNYLPQISTPKLLQAPHEIEPLFPHSRNTVYLLLSAETAYLEPISVTLKAMSPQGPLELEIPVEKLDQPGNTIHQLAARRAVQELEEGRGWIYAAKDASGKTLKSTNPSRIDDFAEREGVRLGVRFQVANKWCSFVATKANDAKVAEPKRRSNLQTENATKSNDFVDADEDEELEIIDASDDDSSSSASAFEIVHAAARSSHQPLYQGLAPSAHGSARYVRPSGYRKRHRTQAPVPLGAPMLPARSYRRGGATEAFSFARESARPQNAVPPPPLGNATETAMQALINKQSFNGSWELNDLPWSLMGIYLTRMKTQLGALESTLSSKMNNLHTIFATMVAVTYLKLKCPTDFPTWELVVEKSNEWLIDTIKDSDEVQQALWSEAQKIVENKG